MTAVTVNTKVSLLEPELASVTVTVMVAVPLRLEAGAILMVRLEVEPPRVILPFGTSVVFEEVAVTVNEVAGVSTSPTVKVMFPVAVSSAVVLSVISLMVGKSFTATTVKTKVSLAVPVSPSVTVTVIVLVPL